MSKTVRRLTPPQIDPRLDVLVSEAAEAIVGISLVASTDIRCDAYDIGCDWFDRTRSMMSAELRAMVAPFERWEAFHSLWHTLLGLVADGPTSLGELVRHLEALPVDEFWLQALGYHDRHDPSAELREAMLAAGRGTLEPLERLMAGDAHAAGRWLQGLPRALGGDPAGTRRRLVELLGRWGEEVFARLWPEIAPILESDAGDKRRLARAASVAAVVEEAANGGEYVPEAGIGRLLLVPTYLSRPWVIHVRQRGTLVMTYPAGEAALAGSPEEARRRRLLRLSKGLSDDTRLRALRRLAESRRSLVELANELGVSKSTMHHHLAVLRSAGLLRVGLGEKRYGLRTGPLADLSGLLGDCLGTAQRRR